MTCKLCGEEYTEEELTSSIWADGEFCEECAFELKTNI